MMAAVGAIAWRLIEWVPPRGLHPPGASACLDYAWQRCSYLPVRSENEMMNKKEEEEEDDKKEKGKEEQEKQIHTITCQAFLELSI